MQVSSLLFYALPRQRMINKVIYWKIIQLYGEVIDEIGIIMAASFTDETLEPVEFKSTWKRERYN